MNAAETDGIRNIEEILNDDAFVMQKCIMASRELYSVLAWYMSSKASTNVRSVTILEGVEARSRLHANFTLGRRFKVQRECMFPTPATVVSQARFLIK